MSGQSQANGVPFWFYPVTWLLVVIGWLIVNWQNNRREERKELRSALSEIYIDIEAIQKKAIKYHKSPSRNEKLETKIIIAERKLSEHLSYLRLRNSAFGPEYSKFVDAITLSNFESANFTSQAHGSKILEGIRDCGIELESALELEFATLFRTNFITKTVALIRQLVEQRSPIGRIMAWLLTHQQAWVTFIAYLFFVGFMAYIVSLVPARTT